MNLNLNGMVSMWKVRELVDKATNIVMNYTETEAKVREATNDDPWGPSGQQMQEIASCTFTYEAFPEVMGMLWKRMLHDERTNWRRIYKSLLLLDYLIKNGSERVVTSAREHVYDLRSLENYTHVDQNGKDQGINIRHKVTDMLEFVQDDDRLREERKKAKKNKDKYIGMSSDSMGFRAGYGGGSGGSGGFSDSGWKGFDGSKPSGGGTTGRWDSDDDANNDCGVQDSRAKEFTDDSFGSEFDKAREETRGNVPRRPSGGSADFDGLRSPSSQAQTKTRKPLKKVDLGAAASFGQKQQEASQSQSQSNNKNNNILDDLFSDSQPKAGQIISSNDDFDPRGSSSNGQSLGFDAFGSDNNNGVNNKSEDDFADFSSAFSGGGSSSRAQPRDDFDLFAAAPASLSQGLPPPVNSGQDLFADFTSSVPAPAPASALAPAPAPAPVMDLFSGLQNSPAPAPPTPSNTLFGAPAPAQHSGGAIDLLDGLAMTSLPPAAMMQQLPPSGSLLQPEGPPSLPAITPSAFTSKPAAVGSTWSDMGALNDKLMNFSLSMGSDSRAAAPSMNALKTQSPPGAPMFGAAPANNTNSISGLDGLL